MGTSRLAPRSISNSRRCPACKGEGVEHFNRTGNGVFRDPQHDEERNCPVCAGHGTLPLRDPDLLVRMAWERRLGRGRYYREVRAQAMRRVPLPGSRYLASLHGGWDFRTAEVARRRRAIDEAEAFRRAERIACGRQVLAEAVSVVRMREVAA